MSDSSDKPRPIGALYRARQRRQRKVESEERLREAVAVSDSHVLYGSLGPDRETDSQRNLIEAIREVALPALDRSKREDEAKQTVPISSLRLSPLQSEAPDGTPRLIASPLHNSSTWTTEQVGAVAEKFSWKEVEFRFQNIHARASGQRLAADFIRTDWESGEVSEEWIVAGKPAFREEFENLASISARKLGCARSKGANEYWLGRVWEWMQQAGLHKDKNVAWLATGTVVQAGLTGTTQGMCTEKIAELSAQFCLELITRGTPESVSAHPEKPSMFPSTAATTGASSRRHRTPTTRKLKIMQAVFAALQGNLEGPKYCTAVDQYRPPISPEWNDSGWPGTYAKAYRDADWAKKIQNQKSKLRKEYDAMTPRDREAVIQGEVSTRRTR